MPQFYSTIYLRPKKKEILALDDVEYVDSQTEIHMWMTAAAVGVVSLIFSLWLPSNSIGFAGYVLFSLCPLLSAWGFIGANGGNA